MTHWDYRAMNEHDCLLGPAFERAWKSRRSGAYLFIVQSTIADITVKQDHQDDGFDDIFDPSGTPTELFVISSNAGDTDKTGTALIINASGALELIDFTLDHTDSTTHVSLGLGLGAVALKLDEACAGNVTITETTDTDAYATVTATELYSNGCWFQAPVGGAELGYWSIWTETTDASRQVAGVAIDGVTVNEQAAASAVGTTKLDVGLVPCLDEYSYCMAESTSEDELDVTQLMIWII